MLYSNIYTFETFVAIPMNQAKKLKDTLNLPQTDFPMRQMPLKMNRKESGIGEFKPYQKMLDKNKGADLYFA